MMKLILVESTIPSDYEDDYDAIEPNVSIVEGDIREFLKRPEFQNMLRQEGWEDVRKSGRLENLQRTNSFFLLPASHLVTQYQNVYGRVFDPENLTAMDIRDITSGYHMVAQGVAMDSLGEATGQGQVYEKAFKALRDVERKQEQLKREVEAKKEAAKKKRQSRELERAKKVLEAAGLQVKEDGS